MFLNISGKGNNRWWAYVITIIAVVAGYGIGQTPLALVIQSKNPGMSEDRLMELIESSNFEALGLDLNTSLVLILLSFVGAFIMLWGSLKKLHKRSLKSLITPFEKVNWSKIFFSFGLWTLFALIIELISYLINPEVYIFQLDWSKFIPLLAICIFILPIQTSFEEVFFRGYLMQGIGLLSKNKLAPLVITSVLFGSMHLLNPEVEKFGTGLMLSYYIGVGFFLGFITLMDDSLELALGIHAATNFLSATFVTFEGTALKTNAIFLTEDVNIELMLLFFLASAALFTFICWRKYRWKKWNNAIGEIENQPELNL